MYKKSKVLKIIRKEMERGTALDLAINRAGINNRATVHYWRKNRPLIDRYILKCILNNRDIRDDSVEDAWFKKLIEGRGSAADYEFYLCNRRPNRWKKNNSDLLHKGEQNVSVNVYPNRITVFKDLKHDRADNPPTGGDAEGNRVKDAPQSP